MVCLLLSPLVGGDEVRGVCLAWQRLLSDWLGADILGRYGDLSQAHVWLWGEAYTLYMSLGPGQDTARDRGKTKRMPSGSIISSFQEPNHVS